MTRVEWFFSVLIVIITCCMVIWSKFLFSSTLLQVQLIEKDLRKKEQHLKALNIEWTKLNSPKLLKALSEKHMPSFVSKYSKQVGKVFSYSVSSSGNCHSATPSVRSTGNSSNHSAGFSTRVNDDGESGNQVIRDKRNCKINDKPKDVSKEKMNDKMRNSLRGLDAENEDYKDNKTYNKNHDAQNNSEQSNAAQVHNVQICDEQTHISQNACNDFGKSHGKNIPRKNITGSFSLDKYLDNDKSDDDKDGDGN